MDQALANLTSAAWRMLLRRIGGSGLAALTLLLLAAGAVLFGLGTVIRGLADRQALAFTCALLGLLAGWRTGDGPFPIRRAVAWFIGAVPWIFLAAGRLWDESGVLALEAYRSLSDWFSLAASGMRFEELPPAGSLSLAWTGFVNGLWLYADDVAGWAADLAAGRPAFRVGAVAFIAGVFFWGQAVWAGWTMRRAGRVFLALLPAGAVLGAALAYTRSDRLGSVAMFLLAALLLQALQTHLSNEARWEIRRLDYPEDLRLDFSFAALAVTALLVLLAYFAPVIDAQDVLQSLLGRGRAEDAAPSSNGVAESLGMSRPTAAPPYLDAFQETGLPQQQLIGAPPEMLEQVALTVRIIGPGLPAGQPYYWRSLTYEVYTGSGWAAGATETLHYRAGDRLPLAQPPTARLVRQEVRTAATRGELVYAAGELLSVDSAFEAAFRSPVAAIYDLFGARRSAVAYRADSQVPLIVAAQLESVPNLVPDWVAARYLALPESLPAGVAALAREIVQGETSAYGQARALEAYLRQFPYSLDVPAPPPDRDVVEYFLFDLQRGYCDYYASAMVVMARVVGLPARLAVGYAQGEYLVEEGLYVVRGKHAHSWPELYFAGFGWVPFEPTAGLAALVPLGPEALPPAAPSGSASPAGPLASLTAALGWLGLGGMGALALLALRQGVDLIRLSRLPPQRVLAELVRRLYVYSRKTGVALPAQATPLELAAALKRHFSSRFAAAGWLPDQAEDFPALIAPYLRSAYSPEQPSEAEKRAVLRRWLRLRIRIVWVEVRSRFRKRNSIR